MLASASFLNLFCNLSVLHSFHRRGPEETPMVSTWVPGTPNRTLSVVKDTKPQTAPSNEAPVGVSNSLGKPIERTP